MTTPLYGQMMDVPLTVSSLLAHASRHFGTVEIVSKRIEGDVHRYTYRDCEKRAKQLAQSLIALGVEAGDRIGTRACSPNRSPSSSIMPTTATCCSTSRSRRSSMCSRRSVRACAAGSR
jgi:acyl-CoA synthetase (AMP-forming)/AMP-acid ligase II